MMGSHLIYHKSRKEARNKIDSEKTPYWLRTYSRIIKNQQASPVFQTLIATLKPWEGDSTMSLAEAQALDERWSTLRERPRNKLALSIRHLVTKRAWFEVLIMCWIVGVGVVTGMELDDPRSFGALGGVVDVLAMVVFTAECVIKLLAEGEKPLRFFSDPEDGWFNSFDFAIVLLSFAFVGQDGQGAVQVMRLMRLMRLLSLIKSVTQLRVIVIGLIQGIKSSIYICILLLMVVYIFAIIAVDSFGANDPAHFGELSVALISLFQVSTLASWTPIVYVSVYGCDEYTGGLYDGTVSSGPVRYKQTMLGQFPMWDCVAPEASHFYTEMYYVVFTTITALVIMSLFIGAIAMAMFSAFSNMEMKQVPTGRRARELGIAHGAQGRRVEELSRRG